MEQHVSNHWTAIDNLRDCATLNPPTPNAPQRVEFLLDSITSQDNALQAAMGNICADTNGLRSDFEGASSHLIEVDPYQRSKKSNPTKPNPLKFQRSGVPDALKPEWAFIGTLNRNFVISPVNRRMN